MNLKDAGIYDLTNIFKGKATDAHGASQGSVINNKTAVYKYSGISKTVSLESRKYRKIISGLCRK